MFLLSSYMEKSLGKFNVSFSHDFFPGKSIKLNRIVLLTHKYHSRKVDTESILRNQFLSKKYQMTIGPELFN